MSDNRRCGFCGRGYAEVKRLVAGSSVYICDRCVATCKQLLIEDTAVIKPDTKAKPKEIVARLNEYIIGQEYAKKILAVALYNHMKRVSFKNTNTLELTKSNIILMGPPGVGKTHLVKHLAKLLDVPFVMVDATPLTQAGYVGEDTESIVSKLLQAADNNVEKAQHGIIYIDEIDKLAAKKTSERDVSGEGVQQALLKIIESTKLVVLQGGNKTTGLGSNRVEIDTTNILFITGGAFDGLDQIVEKRIENVQCGFGTKIRQKFDRSTLYRSVLPEDLLKFGLIPEFVGRFPIRAALDPLSEDMLVEILTKPKDSIVKQFQKMFAMEKSELVFTPEALLSIAKKAVSRKTGARGLRAVIEDLLLDCMFDLPGANSKFTIDDAFIKGGVIKKELIPEPPKKYKTALS